MEDKQAQSRSQPSWSSEKMMMVGSSILLAVHRITWILLYDTGGDVDVRQAVLFCKNTALRSPMNQRRNRKFCSCFDSSVSDDSSVNASLYILRE